MLDNAQTQEEIDQIILDRIYSRDEKSAETLHGRRGVLTLAESIDYLRRLERDKEKVDDFVAKFGDAYGMTAS